MINKYKALFISLLMLQAALMSACGGPFSGENTANKVTEKLPRLVLVGTAGPMTVPLAYIKQNNKLADVAEKTELIIWENPEQLKAIVAGGEGAHFITMPSNSAALFYNKGIPLQMLDISVWGIQYIITSDAAVHTLADLKGEEIIISFKGAVPDILFRYLCKEQGIDVNRDIAIRYVNTPQQAAQMLLSRQATSALLTEPLVTQVLNKSSGVLFRSVDMQEEWGRITGLSDRIPIAGTAALPAIQGNRQVIDRFLEEYAPAAEWVKTHPAEAGALAAGIPQLGFEASAAAEATTHIDWDFVPAKNSKPEMETFFRVLNDFDAGVIGNKLPDNGFYYGLQQ